MDNAITTPFIVDLDGTLLDSDLLFESSLAYFKANPLYTLRFLPWLLWHGKAFLKAKLAHTIPLDVCRLPYNDEVISLIQTEKAKGREIILATASHRIYAEKIAAHLNLFDRVMATEEKTNLTAHHKRDKLVQEFGEKNFDYIGNSHADLPALKAAHRAYIVNPSLGVTGKAKQHGNLERIILTQPMWIKSWIKSLRLHQWVKNLLIFLPLLASHQISNVHFATLLLAFITFGLCASSVYILNDLLDLADDRHHATKRNRPFASGKLSIKVGLLTFPLLLCLSVIISLWALPWPFTLGLLSYYLLTLGYSTVFKRMMVIDVITLAILYTMRIIAGGFAFQVPLTFWILAFSMFIFLSLALVKRYAELREARIKGKLEKTRGRGYYPDDLEMISSLGASSGYLSVLVLALYIQDQKTMILYQHPKMIWLACPLLLYWISRMWLLTHRGLMHDDPITFAIKDRTSLLIGCLFSVIFWSAL